MFDLGAIPNIMRQYSHHAPSNHLNESNYGHTTNNRDDDNDRNHLELSAHCRNITYSYSPNVQFKAQNFLKISRDLTQFIIPNRVGETIADIFQFINKSTAMAHHCHNALSLNTGHDGSTASIIYNYGFHDKETGETLYCIADRIAGNYNQYRMRNTLYTTQDITYVVHPPKSSRRCYPFEMQMVENILASSMADIVCKTKWNRVGVFNVTHNTHCTKQYNKQRLTLFITKQVLMAAIQRFVCDTSSKIQLIPMAMFDEDGCAYRVEYVHVIAIRDNDIGISYCYDRCNDRVEVSG
eukprot:2117_1